MDKNVILKEKRDKACDNTHRPGFIEFWIEHDIFEHRIVFICIFDVIDLDDDEYKRGSGAVGIRLNTDVEVTVKNGILAIWSVRAGCECAGPIVCE